LLIALARNETSFVERVHFTGRTSDMGMEEMERKGQKQNAVPNDEMGC
jgi:hypothetical protein